MVSKERSDVFRKFQKSKTLDVNCPYCEHSQREPSLVISSYCRACGEHFRVRKGRAVPDPGLKVSGIAEVRSPETPETKSSRPRREPESAKPDEKTPEDAWLLTAENPEGDALPLHKAEGSDTEEEVGISAGAFFGLVDPEETDEPEEPESGTPDEPLPKDALAHGTVGALIEPRNAKAPAPPPKEDKAPSRYVPPWKRRKNDAPNADFEVRCYRCYHLQTVSRFAKSTQCERCNAYISLADYEIKAVKSHTLRTRGDIVISKKGGLHDCEIACRNLTVNGAIDCGVDCSGDAVFRHSGIVRGHLHCRRLLIEKKCVVQFPDGALAARADIHGECLGNLTSSGTVTIFSSGIVVGDVTAVTIDIREGGKITGETEIDPETSANLPLKMGFNPSIIG
ncbi:MAG: polymer-forming cytoskeletal protein [Verrucomicrobiales bacterium]